MEIKKRNEISQMLVDKIIEWRNHENSEEIIVDTFVKAIQSTGMNDSDVVSVLDYAANYLAGTAHEKVKCESMAIKVSNGY